MLTSHLSKSHSTSTTLASGYAATSSSLEVLPISVIPSHCPNASSQSARQGLAAVAGEAGKAGIGGAVDGMPTDLDITKDLVCSTSG